MHHLLMGQCHIVDDRSVDERYEMVTKHCVCVASSEYGKHKVRHFHHRVCDMRNLLEGVDLSERHAATTTHVKELCKNSRRVRPEDDIGDVEVFLTGCLFRTLNLCIVGFIFR